MEQQPGRSRIDGTVDLLTFLVLVEFVSIDERHGFGRSELRKAALRGFV